MTVRYENIVWDWNGTLVDDAWLCVDVLNALLAGLGRGPIDVAYYRQHFRFPAIEFYRHLGFEFDRAAFLDLSERFNGRYNAGRHACRLHAGSLEVLRACRELGLRQYVLSAYLQEFLEEQVAELGVGEFFAELVGNSDLLGASKLEYGRRRFRALGLDPARTLLVGDTRHDYEVAQALGFTCLLLEHGHTTRERLEPLGVPVLGGLDELPRHLENNTHS